MVARIKTEAAKPLPAQTFHAYLVAKTTEMFGPPTSRGVKQQLVNHLHDHGLTASKATICRWIGLNPTEPSHKNATQVMKILDAATSGSAPPRDCYSLTMRDVMALVVFARSHKEQPSPDMIAGFMLGRQNAKGKDREQMP